MSINAIDYQRVADLMEHNESYSVDDFCYSLAIDFQSVCKILITMQIRGQVHSLNFGRLPRLRLYAKQKNVLVSDNSRRVVSILDRPSSVTLHSISMDWARENNS